MPEINACKPGLAVCIATYRRVPQLKKLIGDIVRQTILPETLAVIDGDPSSGEVEKALESLELPVQIEVVYVRSGHASLPYQRYLGWRACVASRQMVYLDDDLRIPQRDFLEKIMAPLSWEPQKITGVTCSIAFGDPTQYFQTSVLQLTTSGPRFWHSLMNQGRLELGGVSPSGHRRMPANTGLGYEAVDWLSGAVMAVRTEALDENCFPEIGFALFKARLGTGEDLVLARHLHAKGQLIFAYCAEVEHPYEVPTNFGPQDFFRLGLTYAYGERYANDHHRGAAGPSLADRLALARSLVATLVLNWGRALLKPERRRWIYAWGFTLGTFQALFAFPQASTLFPEIDWKGEAAA